MVDIIHTTGEKIMRLRNIPGADEIVSSSLYSIQNPTELKGHWHEFLHTDAPIHIEIGMGKGRFLMDLAAANPDIQYIGIERYTIDAATIADIFALGEVDRIYLNFSDPWPKDRHAKRRLTSQQFLERYDQILTPDGRLEFKTDNQDLFAFSLDEIDDSDIWHLDAFTWDLHNDAAMNRGNIMTEYEEKFSSMGNPICKLIASR